LDTDREIKAVCALIVLNAVAKNTRTSKDDLIETDLSDLSVILWTVSLKKEGKVLRSYVSFNAS